MIRWQQVGDVLVRQCMVKGEKRGFVSGGATTSGWVTLPAVGRGYFDTPELLIEHLRWKDPSGFTDLGLPDDVYEFYFPEHPIPADLFLGELP